MLVTPNFLLHQVFLKYNALSEVHLQTLLEKCKTIDIEPMMITNLEAVKEGKPNTSIDKFFDYENDRQLVLDYSNAKEAYATCNIFEDTSIWPADSEVVSQVSDFFQQPLTIQCTYFYRYIPGGFLRSHSDNSVFDEETQEWVQTEPFEYTALVYLNDEYEGGEICFDELNVSFKPVSNLLLAFPAHYLHSVKPVISGLRCAYSLKLCAPGKVGLRTRWERENG
jgi:hypothetical protein